MTGRGDIGERLGDTALFGDLDATVRRALADRLVPITLEGGEVLMREGDPADGLYLVRAGRLQARVGPEGGVAVIGEIGRGEVVGESALLTEQTRTATVVALRDTELLRLSVASFEEVVAAHPSFLRPVAAQVVDRMLAARIRPNGSRPVASVAVVQLHADRVARLVTSRAIGLVLSGGGARSMHRRGRGWRAVRASMSIPGVFPPVAERGDVLVDGGLVDNLPVGEMRASHDGITVVAVDVGVHRGITAGDLPDDTVVHGWRLVLDRLHPARRSPQVAGILSILTRLTELGGGSRAVDRGDVLIRPDVERFPMLDFSNFGRIVDAGHHEAHAVLGPWWSERAA